VLLHLYQPIELGSEELGKVRPNEGVMYHRVDELSFFLSFFLSIAKTQEEADEALKNLEAVK
jgi:hypothetical protein